MDLKDKVIWITGASSGIGEALALAYNARGAKVVLSARRENALETVQNMLPNKEAASLVLPFDMGDHDAFEPCFQEVLSTFGGLDMIIQNAGITCSGFAVDLGMDIQRRVMEIDHFSNVALSKTVLPYFMKKDSGQIIVVSSILGQLGAKNRSAYSAAKHALHGYYDCLRAETSTNIHIGILSPGYVRTDVLLNAVTADGSRLNKRSKDNEKGMEPDVFAQIAIRKIAKRKPIVYVAGMRERLGIYLSTFTPSLYARIARNLDHEL